MSLSGLIITIFFLLSTASFGQQSLEGARLPKNIKFDNYSLPQGLSQTTVVCLLQDKKGFLWIGTQDGLNRFDGYKFKIYKKSKTDLEHSLGGNYIWDLVEDKAGRIWIAHDGGVSCYNPLSDSFESISIEAGATTIRTLFLQDDNKLWLGSSGQGLFLLETTSKTVSKFVNDVETNLTKNNILDIAEGGNGMLLIGTRGAGIFSFSKQEGFFRPSNDCATYPLLAENDVWNIQRKNSFVWLGTRKGLLKLTEGYGFADSFGLTEDPSKPKRVSSFTFNSGGDIWIATYGGGLVYFHTATGLYDTFLHSDFDAQSLAHDLVFSLLFDRSDNLWIGTWLGGMSKLRSSFRNFIGYSNAMIDQPSNFVTTVSAIPCETKEILLVGTYGGGIHPGSLTEDGVAALDFKQASQFSRQLASKTKLINFIFKGSKNIWFGTDDQGVIGIPLMDLVCDGVVSEDNIVSLDKDLDKSLSNPVKAIAEDAMGNLWVGTIGGGATMITNPFSQKKLRVSNFVFRENDSTSLCHNRVNHILVDGDKNIWLATSNGLNLFNDGTFYRYLTGKIITVFQHSNNQLYVGTEDGLFRSEKASGKVAFQPVKRLDGYLINSIQEGKGGNLWISTNNGLIEYWPDTEKMYVFKSSDGLIDDEYNYNASVQSAKGDLFFGGVNGLTALRPRSIRLNNYMAEPLITSIKLNNKEIALHGFDSTTMTSVKTAAAGNQLNLKYDQNNISFEFASTDLTNPQKNNFAFTLEGFEKDWVRTDAFNRIATYTNLNPGKYVFKLKACNSDGLWNDTASTLVIVIAPPAWRTSWAYAIYFLVALMLFFIGQRAIVNRERLKAQVALEQKENQSLQELDNLKTKFFSNITHEFRTPLTLIQGPARELISREEDPQKRSLLELISKNSNRLLMLVNQLLDLAKLDAKKASLNLAHVSLIELIKAATAQFAAQASSRGIVYSVLVEDSLPVVSADVEKLEAILFNLISNALKFTGTGGKVEVSAKWQHTHLCLSVADTGRGIPSDKLVHIFDRFYQVNPTDSTHSEGTGIGLALVKEYVELMKGRIKVESQVDKGTLFEIELPLLVVSVAEQRIATGVEINAHYYLSEGEPAADPTSPLILLVEDSNDIRTFIRSCLGSHYSFLEANHGVEGLAKARTEIPDLIISDWMMPELDGVSLCDEIKKDMRTSHIPFILLTAKATDVNKNFALEKGANDYLVKPFNKQELVLKVRNLLDQQKKLQVFFQNRLRLEGTQTNVVSADDKFVKKAVDYVEIHMTTGNISVEGLSNELALSREQCYRKMVALTGMSPSTFIRKIRLKKAMQLLASKSGNVSEVAYLTGFDNLSYFSKTFKEEFGKLPSEV